MGADHPVCILREEMWVQIGLSVDARVHLTGGGVFDRALSLDVFLFVLPLACSPRRQVNSRQYSNAPPTWVHSLHRPFLTWVSEYPLVEASGYFPACYKPGILQVVGFIGSLLRG